MGAVTLKCAVCGKEITGLTEGHAQRLLRIHKAVKHGLEMTEEERRLVGIVRKCPKEIIEALNDEYTRDVIMGIFVRRANILQIPSKRTKLLRDFKTSK